MLKVSLTGLKNNITGLFILVLLVVIAIPARGDKLIYSAKNMKTVLAEKKERTLLDGDAQIESGDILITSDHIDMYGKNQSYVSCDGNIYVLNTRTGVEITCEKLFFDRNKNMIRIQGNAIMEDKKNEVIIKGGFIENWDDESRTIIQINVRILKEDMVCRSESAVYYREKDYLELSGMPVVIKEGDEYRALKINIDLENDEVMMEGSVEGEVTWEEEEAPAEEEAVTTGAPVDTMETDSKEEVPGDYILSDDDTVKGEKIESSGDETRE